MVRIVVAVEGDGGEVVDEVEVEVDEAEDLSFFRFQLFSITDVPPDEQVVVADGMDALPPSAPASALGLGEGQRVVVRRRGAADVEEEEEAKKGDEARHERLRRERAARIAAVKDKASQKKALAAALASAQGSLGMMVELDRAHQRMKRRLASHMSQVLSYENPALQRRARETMPVEELRRRAADMDPAKGDARDRLLVALMEWFKKDFFKWVNQAPCELCGGQTVAAGSARPNEAETHHRAGVVELYRCGNPQCGGHVTRFPRYNDAGKLLETRRGRCGEWANCFTLCLRALGFEARTAVDFTDHVWAEVYSESLGRWQHADPCENALDSPLMYESGWGKKLNYVLAFSKDECLDVTRRYTEHPDKVAERRTLASEEWLAAELDRLDRSRLRMSGALRRSELEARRRAEMEELDAGPDATRERREAEQRGRATGSVEWRRARGELGAVPSPAEPPAAPAAPVAADPGKARVRALFGAYLVQLVKGCGRDKCDNPECRSSGDACRLPKGMDKKAAAARALALVSKSRERGLCPPLRPPPE